MKSRIPDLRDLEEFRDELEMDEHNYEDDLYKKIYSNVMFKNENMHEYVKWTGRVFSLWIDSVGYIRNMLNLSVDKSKKDYKN